MKEINCIECNKLTSGECGNHTNGTFTNQSMPVCPFNPQGNGVHQWIYNKTTAPERYNCMFCRIKAY